MRVYVYLALKAACTYVSQHSVGPGESDPKLVMECHKYCHEKIRTDVTLANYAKWKDAQTPDDVKKILAVEEEEAKALRDDRDNNFDLDDLDDLDDLPSPKGGDPKKKKKKKKKDDVDVANDQPPSRNGTFNLSRLPNPNLTEDEEKDL